MPMRPRLTPAVAEVRRAVREALAGAKENDLVLVAVSGGPDSMALAVGFAFEGPKLGLRIAAVIVDHQLQSVSGEVAEKTAETLKKLGFGHVYVKRVDVAGTNEAAAREARYHALDELANELDARFVLLGHTLNDQAESVLLGLARGSGARSLSGMASANGRYLRPLLGVSRAVTLEASADLDPWHDPHNKSEKFTRVRVRETVLPVLEEELGPGVAEALARTAEQLREDADYLEEVALAEYHSMGKSGPTSLTLPVTDLEELQPAIRFRVIKHALEVLQCQPQRVHVLAVNELIVDWHGQKELTLPGVRVVRKSEQLELKTTKTLKPGAC
jgi:tRNA(Ile)-lysidine synthase